MKVSGEDVQGVHGCHAVPLAHQPAPCASGQIVQSQIAGIGRHHVQCPAGVAFRIGLEVLRRQRLAGDINPAGVGHVDYQPETGTGESVQVGEFTIDRGSIGLVAGSNQVLCQ